MKSGSLVAMDEVVKAPARRKWSLDELDRLAAEGGLAVVSDHLATETLIPLCVPGLTLRLADFDFGTDGLEERET